MLIRELSRVIYEVLDRFLRLFLKITAISNHIVSIITIIAKILKVFIGNSVYAVRPRNLLLLLLLVLNITIIIRSLLKVLAIIIL